MEQVKVVGAYNQPELDRLHELASRLVPGSMIVEIGCMYGRSTQAFIPLCQEHGHRLIIIDNWSVSESDAEPAFHKMMQEVSGVDWTGLWEDSNTAVDKVPDGIGLLHIDGNHQPEGISTDLMNYAPKVKAGGYLVAHDYDTRGVDGGLCFPGIRVHCDRMLADWEFLGVVDSQAAWMKARR